MPESPQGIYAPLPQSLTDSESEEEIHSSANSTSSIRVNHNRNGNTSNNNKNHNSKMNDASCIIGEGTEIIMSNNHNSCDDNSYVGIYSDDNVAILQHDADKGEPMSWMRKCCFILSLQMCVLTVVVFIWVLPCSDNLSCPAPSDLIKTHKWIREYENIELKGMINVVDGLRGRSKNLVFMYRGDKIFDNHDDLFARRSGIICLIGSMGQVSWYDELNTEPKIIDCNLLDADKDGSKDCLISDDFSKLRCINPISGQWIWKIPSKEDIIHKKGDLLDFPLILPDLNGDGVNELLLASSSHSNRHNSLIIISGSSGSPIGSAYTISECTYIHKLQIDQKFTISFNCVNNESELEKFKKLSELYQKITNHSIDLTYQVNRPIEQHKFFGQRKNTVNQRNIYSVSGKQLIVENRGVCPDFCNVSVVLIDQKNGKEYNLSNASSMYGMVPTQLSFNKSNIDSKSSVHGFVIKFWEFNTQNETYYNNNDRVFKRENLEEEFNLFSNIVVRKKRWSLPTNNSRQKRDINDNHTNNFFRSKMRLIKETIVLIVFNSTETRIVNTSQSNIIQFCKEEKGSMICQPDLNYQENSLLVADLDKDGSQELVSYYTTFINSEDSLNEWKLITYVQLLRLEAELPKLYDADFKN